MNLHEELAGFYYLPDHEGLNNTSQISIFVKLKLSCSFIKLTIMYPHSLTNIVNFSASNG